MKTKLGAHVARMGNVRNAYRTVVTKPEGGDRLEDQGIDRRLILKLNIK
jgi:hypothetical protein